MEDSLKHKWVVFPFAARWSVDKHWIFFSEGKIFAIGTELDSNNRPVEAEFVDDSPAQQTDNVGFTIFVNGNQNNSIWWKRDGRVIVSALDWKRFGFVVLQIVNGYFVTHRRDDTVSIFRKYNVSFAIHCSQ